MENSKRFSFKNISYDMDISHLLIFKLQIGLLIDFMMIIVISTLNHTGLYFSGDQYLFYSPSTQPVYEQTNINRIQLEFRTIHPSGILVVMGGKGKDVLVLQLIQGRLR